MELKLPILFKKDKKSSFPQKRNHRSGHKGALLFILGGGLIGFGLIIYFLLLPVFDIFKSRGVQFIVSNPTVEQPGGFLYELAPGSAKEDSLLVTNTSDETVEVRVYSMDTSAVEVREDGKVDTEPEPYTDEPDEIGAWVTFSNIARGESFTLEAKEEKSVTFTVTVPEGAAYGDHYGALSIVYSSTDSLEHEAAIGIEYQVLKRLHVRVAEESRELELLDYSSETDAIRSGYQMRMLSVFFLVNILAVTLIYFILKKK